MTPFHLRVPEPGLREVRSIHVLDPEGALPEGEYAFFELYCDKLECDCRRVLLQVISPQAPDTVLATINFGWESIAFYTKWMHGDAAAGREITKACLDPLNPQSQYAKPLLDLFRNVPMSDPDYVARLASHYAMFKQTLRPRAKVAP